MIPILALPRLNRLTGQSVIQADLGRSGAIPILLGKATLFSQIRLYEGTRMRLYTPFVLRDRFPAEEQ